MNDIAIKAYDVFGADRETVSPRPIKAIETVYNGYRFRSRLEARWAVFFDAAGIKYQYEPEGYAYDGTRYLPDFYLPEADTHVEVKPNVREAIPDIERCIKMIVWGGPIKRIVFLSDIPGECDGGLWHFPVIFWRNNGVDSGWYYFTDVWPEGKVSGATYRRPFIITYEDKIWINERRPLQESFTLSAVSDLTLSPKRGQHTVLHQVKDGHVYAETVTNTTEELVEEQLCFNSTVFKAFRKARQARFEHGEKP